MDLGELASFLVKAKKNTYAVSNSNAEPERVGFNELEYSEGDYYYRDSYTGFFQAPGQEVVRYKGVPVWVMSYNGGMLKQYQTSASFASEVFNFLKKALKQVPLKNPYRGPRELEENDYYYENEVEGDITNFKGNEKIFYKGDLVFEQDYMGGLIIQK